MSKTLSHSAVRLYTECGRKYKLHYKDKLRSKYIGGALLYGSAIDSGLNELLLTKDVDKAIEVFDKSFNFQYVNKVYTNLSISNLVVYAEKDFDHELLTEADHNRYKELKTKLGLDNTSDLVTDIKAINENKKRNGFKNLEEVEKTLYSLANWMCLYRKGLIMIKSYNEKVMPKIDKVLAVQKKSELDNGIDKVVIYLDLIVQFKDGTRFLLDNKTSTRDYESDSAGKSQQLVLYYYAVKEEYKLDGVGFIVLYKQIVKNREKICKSCGYKGEGTHRKCNNEPNGKRCNGEWDQKIDPECRIEIILNDVKPQAEDLIIQVFDEASEGIEKESFGPNLGACGSTSSEYRCGFFNHCWSGDDSDLIKLEN